MALSTEDLRVMHFESSQRLREAFIREDPAVRDALDATPARLPRPAAMHARARDRDREQMR